MILLVYPHSCVSLIDILKLAFSSFIYQNKKQIFSELSYWRNDINWINTENGQYWWEIDFAKKNVCVMCSKCKQNRYNMV